MQAALYLEPKFSEQFPCGLCRSSIHKEGKVFAGLEGGSSRLELVLVLAKHHGRQGPYISQNLVVKLECASLGQANDGYARVDLRKFLQPLIPRFTVMAFRLYIGVMRIDLEWQQTQRLKTLRFYYGHVIGGTDGGA